MKCLFSRLAAAVAVLTIATGVARAEVIFQAQGIGFDGASFASELVAFDPFDPELGTLDEAIFFASLDIIYEVRTFFVPDGSGNSLPTTVSGIASFAIDGVTWPFRFSADCFMNATRVSGESAVFVSSVDMSWRSDAVSDLTGMTVGQGGAGFCFPSLVNPVQRSDYLATLATSATGLLTDLRSTWQVDGTAGPVLASFFGFGSLTLQYVYTPHPDAPGDDPEPVPVPEPATGLLLGIGLACLGIARGRKRRSG